MAIFRRAYANVTANIDTVVISHDVKKAVSEAQLPFGIAQVFVPVGSAGVAILENDPKIYEDYKKWIELHVPPGIVPTAVSGPETGVGSKRGVSLRAGVGLPAVGAGPPVVQEKRPERRSGTGHNYAHVRAQLVGHSVIIPIAENKLQMGAWQEVVLFDFDDKIGRREFFILVMGEAAAGGGGGGGGLH